MKIKWFITIWILLFSTYLIAQSEETPLFSITTKNVDYLLDDNHLTIYYDILDEEHNRIIDFEVVIQVRNKTIIPQKGITGHMRTMKGRRKITWWYKSEGYNKSDFEGIKLMIEINPIDYNVFDPSMGKGDLWKDVGTQPSLAPLNLKKRQSEFNILTTRAKENEIFNFNPDGNHFRNINLEDFDSISISPSYGVSLSYMRGFTKTGWLSAGINVRYQFSNIDSVDNQLSFGPTIRWRPFGLIGKNTDFIVSNSVLIRTEEKIDNTLSSTKYSFENQFTLTQYLRPLKLILLASANLNVLPKSTRGELLDTQFIEKKHPIYLSYTGLVGFYPKRNFLFFGSVNYGNEYGNVPWSTDSYRFRRNQSTSLNAGAQWTIFNTYSLYGGYSFELENKFGGQVPFGYFGLRCLF